jgi:hypothetical protein
MKMTVGELRLALADYDQEACVDIVVGDGLAYVAGVTSPAGLLQTAQEERWDGDMVAWLTAHAATYPDDVLLNVVWYA